jgi:hypothetical protein
LIAKHLETEAFFEPVGENPVLPLYYADPKQYGFLLQIYFFLRTKEALRIWQLTVNMLNNQSRTAIRSSEAAETRPLNGQVFSFLLSPSLSDDENRNHLPKLSDFIIQMIGKYKRASYHSLLSDC